MTKTQALALQREIEILFERHKLHYKVEKDVRDKLKYIKFTEVSIKVSQPDK